MDENEFNFHRIIKTEKNVAQPAIKELFETLWDRKFPDTPWAKDGKSVELFEQTEGEHFQKSLENLSNKEKGRKIDRRNRLKSTFTDDEWNTYEWDISKFAYALIDSKLFKLDETDENGMSVSEHIVKIRDIRNKTAHFETSTCDIAYFKKTLKEIADHIKALELEKLNVLPYLEELQRIESEEKPVSCQKWYEMRTECEKLKISQQIYVEREKRYIEREKHCEETERLKNEYELLKSTHLKEIERLHSENKQLKRAHSLELERLHLENKQLKQTYSGECGRLQSKNEQLKQRYFEKLLSFLSENELQGWEFDRQRSHTYLLQHSLYEERTKGRPANDSAQTHSILPETVNLPVIAVWVGLVWNRF